MNTIHPKDIIALVCIAYILVMKLKGLDGALDPALAIILGYYFVKRQQHIDNGK